MYAHTTRARRRVPALDSSISRHLQKVHRVHLQDYASLAPLASHVFGTSEDTIRMAHRSRPVVLQLPFSTLLEEAQAEELANGEEGGRALT